MNEIVEKLVTQQLQQVDAKIWFFFEPYLRDSGIKGEITKGKVKWRGIRLKTMHERCAYKLQLNQRGVDISPVLTIKLPCFDALEIRLSAKTD